MKKFLSLSVLLLLALVISTGEFRHHPDFFDQDKPILCDTSSGISSFGEKSGNHDASDEDYLARVFVASHEIYLNPDINPFSRIRMAEQCYTGNIWQPPKAS
jgi:hypothetical protein